MIAVVDYGMGNLRSVEKGLLKVGADARVISDPRSVDDAHAVVVPGVGAFRDCVRNLNDRNLTGSILRSIEKGKPYLGICLGLQVLFSVSEEFGTTEGLGVLKGKVVLFPKSDLRVTHPPIKVPHPPIKVPHMGWNTVKYKNRPPIFNGVPDNSYFYFVHSYYVVPEDEDVIAGTTDYGLEFTSMVWKDNIVATQFHPEKSQQTGLKVLEAFNEFVKKA